MSTKGAKLKSSWKKLEGIFKGTLNNIRFDRYVDCLIDRLTVQEKYFNNYVVRNQKHYIPVEKVPLPGTMGKIYKRNEKWSIIYERDLFTSYKYVTNKTDVYYIDDTWVWTHET